MNASTPYDRGTGRFGGRARRRGQRAGIALLVAVLAIGAAKAFAHHALSRAQAAAAATAINVRQGDLPTLKGQTNPVTAQQRALQAKLAACTGETPDSKVWALAQSPSFTSSGASGLTVESSTRILPTTALVAKDLAAVAGSKALACMQTELASQLHSTLPASDEISLRSARMPSVVSGSDGSFSVRFTVTVTVKSGSTKQNVVIYDDSIGFAWGQAEVGLNVVSQSVTPPLQLERTLAANLIQRARSAIG